MSKAKLKISYLVIVIMGVLSVSTVNAATYYSGANASDLSAVAQWWVNNNASGAHPANFTTAGDIFIVQAAHTSCTFVNSTTFGSAANAVTLNVDGAFTINTTKTLTIGVSGANSTIVFSNTAATQITLAGTGIFTLASGQTLKTANANGIRGANCSIGAGSTCNLNTGANYEFNRAGAQASLALPATVNTLTISNGSTTTLGQNTVISTTLTVKAGATLNLSTFTLSSPSTALENGTTASTISGSGLFTLGGNVAVTTPAGTGTGAVISCPIALTNAQTRTFTVANASVAAGDLQISGIISTTGALTKAGAGILKLSGANSYSGGTTCSAGTLLLGAAGTLVTTGSGGVTLNGGTLKTGSGAGFTDGTSGTPIATGLTFSTSSTIAFGTGAHTLAFAASNANTWVTDGSTLTITGWAGGYNGSTGTAGQLFIGAATTGLTGAQLSMIQFYDGASYYPATILSSGEVVPSSASYATGPGGVFSGLVGWFSAGNTGNTTSTWYNYTGYGDATGTGSPTVNTSGTGLMNFNETYSFTSGKYFILSTNLNLGGNGNGYTFHGAAKLDGTDDDRVFGNSTSDCMFGYYLNLENTLYLTGTPGFIVNGANGVVAATDLPIFHTFTRTTGEVVKLRRNGVQTATNATSNDAVWTMQLNGYNGGNNQTSTCTISEFISYSKCLSATELNKVESYLAIKYGQTLDQSAAQNYVNSSATIIWDATTNVTYKYNIAGIGRDDASRLDQEQSQSQNSGFQPVIGNASEINTSNTAHTGSFSADKSFEIWGSDNGSTNFATAFAFGTATFRMTRIWKVLESGTVGTVKVAAAVSDFGSVSLPYLVVSSDAVFDGTDTRTSMTKETIGGVSYYTATVNFTTGQFFTFAGLITSPGGISANLKLWLKADGPVTSNGGDGTNVSTWSDASGNGYDVTQGTSGNQPQYYSSTASQLINFNPTVYFDGSTNYLKNTNPLFLATSAYSFIGVSTDESAVPGTYHTMYACDNNVNDWSFYKEGGAAADNGWVMYTSGARHVTNPGGIGFSASGANGYYNGANYTSNANTQTNTPQISAMTGTISGVVNPISYIDGYSANYSAFTNTDANYFQSFGIGAEVAGAEPWFGRIPEFIAYSTNLSAANMIKVNSYLAIKYGTTLGQGGTNPNIFANDNNYNYQASDATVIWNTATNGTYKYHIAGIGRDDLSGLDQEQSQSQNPNFQPIIGNASDINTSNATHTGSFSADKSFEVWGCDGASTSFGTAFAFGTATFRMTRVWKLQETGTVGTVKVAAKVCDLPSLSLPYLLISNDAIFDGTDTRTSMTKETIGGVNYYTATVNFTTGQFFTFAGLIASPGGVSTNLKLWLKADGCPTSTGGDGTNVSTWLDASTNGYNVTQNTSGNQPQLYTTTASKLLNFNPSIYFDGSANYLSNSSALFAANSAYSFIGVSTDESTASATYHALYSCDDLANAWSFYKVRLPAANSSSWNMWTDVAGPNVTCSGAIAFSASGGPNGYYNGASYTSDASTATTTPQISAITGTITGVGAKPISYIDGYSASYAVYTNTNTHYFQGFNIGAEAAGVEPWFGRVPEFAAYSTNLSAANMIKVNSYMAIKYGTTLGQGGTNPNIFANDANYNYQASDASVIWDATANTTYKYHIAGIGRDDLSALDQEQSQSQNPNMQPIIGNASNINTSNSTHTGSFSVDKSFEVWGCDGASTNFATAFAFGTSTFRMTRVWKVQETGTVGTVKVAVKICDFVGNVTDPYLLVSNDATFDGTDTRTAMIKESIGGEYYYTATTNFTNGQFFSFSGLLAAPGGISTNLKLWLKADGCVTSTGGDGTNISTWLDASGNGYDVTQGTSGNQPQFYSTTSSKLINFNPIVDFDGSANYLENTSPLFAATSAYSFIAAATDESTASATYHALYSCDDIANAWSFYKVQLPAANSNPWNMWTAVAGPNATNTGAIGFSDAGGPHGYYNGASYTSNASTVFITPQISAITGTITGVGAKPISYIDGYSANYAVYTNTNTHYFQEFHIGAEDAGVEPWFGRISEFIAYNNNLSAAQMIKENTYLSIKYGTTLGQGGTNPNIFANDGNYDYQNTSGTVVWDATTNSGFKYNIAGIGKDRVEGLEQKISTSSNGVPDIVTISLDNDFTSPNNDPAARPSSFNSDLSYLVWGTDNTATAFATTYNTSLNYRMTRKWKMQKTNFTNQVYFKFTDNDIANSTPYYLIANASALETGWTQLDAATSEVAGNTVTFGPVSLGANNYFAVSNAVSPLPIELLSFQTILEKNIVNIIWKTASEINNDYFTVERSVDGVNFVTIAIIPSKANGGNSSSILSYSLDDENVTEPGVYYYRLKQTDFNGAYTYSHIEAIEIKGNSDFSFNIVPNPNKGSEFGLMISSEKNQEVVIAIYDLVGQMIFSKTIRTEQNGSTIYTLEMLQQLNLGVYIITATLNEKVYIKKLIVN